jgi:hypothetical protein
LRPFRVGCPLFHRSSLILILSKIGSQGEASFTQFPIHAPRERVASPSFAIRMFSFSVLWSSWLIFLISSTVILYLSGPMGIISVFSMLNFAPEALHHLSRRDFTWSKQSLWLRYKLVSPAKKLAISFSSRPGIRRPVSLGLFLSVHAKGSIAKLKARQERGSPCLTPRVIWNGLLR